MPEISFFELKVFLWIKGSPARHIFHLSGKRFGIEDDEWKGIPKNQLVFIGQNLEQEKLRELLEGCVCLKIVWRGTSISYKQYLFPLMGDRLE